MTLGPGPEGRPSPTPAPQSPRRSASRLVATLDGLLVCVLTRAVLGTPGRPRETLPAPPGVNTDGPGVGWSRAAPAPAPGPSTGRPETRWAWPPRSGPVAVGAARWVSSEGRRRVAEGRPRCPRLSGPLAVHARRPAEDGAVGAEGVVDVAKTRRDGRVRVGRAPGLVVPGESGDPQGPVARRRRPRSSRQRRSSVGRPLARAEDGAAGGVVAVERLVAGLGPRAVPAAEEPAESGSGSAPGAVERVEVRVRPVQVVEVVRRQSPRPDTEPRAPASPAPPPSPGPNPDGPTPPGVRRVTWGPGRVNVRVLVSLTYLRGRPHRPWGGGLPQSSPILCRPWGQV